MGGKTRCEIEDPHLRRIGTRLLLKGKSPQIRIDVGLSSKCFSKLGEKKEVSIYVKFEAGFSKGVFDFSLLSECVRSAVHLKLNSHREENGCSMVHLCDDDLACANDAELRLLAHSLLEAFDHNEHRFYAPSPWENAMRVALGRRHPQRAARNGNSEKKMRKETRDACEWEDGTEFPTKHQRHNAKSIVMDAAIARCGGSRRRVAEVLSAIMVDIGWSPELLLPEIRIYEISQAEEVITNIRGTVQRLTKQRMTDDAYTALFAIIAACAPVASSTRADHILKRYLGVRDDTASHYATAFEARDRFDDYHNLQEDHRVEINVAKGRNLSPPPPLPMLPGQRVTCIAGKGTLDKCDDAGCVVHLDSCDDKLYYPHPGSGAGGAQLKHLEPSLLPRIRRKERNKHKALKALILNWHENSGENPRSPNTKGICKRRLARGHVVQARTIYRFLTFRGLWDAFRRDHPNLSARLCARDKKTGEPLWDEVPTLFRTNVPWNMKRGKDKGCLCLSCEELGVKARAQVHVARRLEALLVQWQDQPVGRSAPRRSTKCALRLSTSNLEKNIN